MTTSNKSALNYFVTASAGVSDSTITTGSLYKAINISSGSIAENGRDAGGVITHTGSVGMRATYDIVAISKFSAGLAVTVNQGLTVTTSGYFIPANSGDVRVGRATTNTTSGSVGQAMFNFATPVYITSCFDNLI